MGFNSGFKGLKNAPPNGKIMVTVFWDKKVVVAFLKFLPKQITMNAGPYSKTLRNPNAGLRLSTPPTHAPPPKKCVCTPSMTTLSFT